MSWDLNQVFDLQTKKVFIDGDLIGQNEKSFLASSTTGGRSTYLPT